MSFKNDFCVIEGSIPAGTVTCLSYTSGLVPSQENEIVFAHS